jgi:2-dehydro-3-deoxygluconokinase
MDVVTFGESMGMFVAEEPGDLCEVERFSRRLAGAETNVAIGLARLGLDVGWVSRVGADSLGRYILQMVAREQVDVRRVAIDSGRSTGFLLKSRAEDGRDPAVEYYRRGSAASHLAPADLDPDYFRGARHLHVTGITPALSETAMALMHEAMGFMRAAGRTVSFDPNLRPALWPSEAEMIHQINALAARADWVLPGLGEGRRLTGLSGPEAIAGFYLEQGASVVVVKLGPDGAYFRDATGDGHVPAVAVAEVVDTVGAGDGFAAGVISGLLEGLTVARAAARGTLIGALAIQASGDMDGLPTRAQLNAAADAAAMRDT